MKFPGIGRMIYILSSSGLFQIGANHLKAFPELSEENLARNFAVFSRQFLCEMALDKAFTLGYGETQIWIKGVIVFS